MTTTTVFRVISWRSALVSSLGTFLLTLSVWPALSQPVWTIHKSNTTQTLRGVTYGRGQFVAVGDNGAIITSSNGTEWKSQSSGTDNTLYSIVYGMGYFIAVGENAILTSSDGMNWTAYEPAPDYKHLRGISYGDGRFVAAAGFSGVLSSTNGKDWFAQPLITSNYLTSICFGENRFMAVGGQGAAYSSSPENKDVDWKLNNLPTVSSSQKTTDLTHVYYGGGRFIAVGAKVLFVSSDGLHWAKAGVNPMAYLYGVTYDGSQFVAVGYNGLIQTSVNGTAWATQSVNTNKILYGVCHSESRLVAVGADGTIVSAVSNKSSDRSTAQTDAPANQAIKASTESELTALGLATERSEQVLVYPNPSDNGRFNLSLPKGVRRVSVISGQGYVILDWPEPAALSEINLSPYVSGMYWLRIENATGQQTLKLIKP